MKPELKEYLDDLEDATTKAVEALFEAAAGHQGKGLVGYGLMCSFQVSPTKVDDAVRQYHQVKNAFDTLSRSGVKKHLYREVTGEDENGHAVLGPLKQNTKGWKLDKTGEMEKTVFTEEQVKKLAFATINNDYTSFYNVLVIATNNKALSERYTRAIFDNKAPAHRA